MNDVASSHVNHESRIVNVDSGEHRRSGAEPSIMALTHRLVQRFLSLHRRSMLSSITLFLGLLYVNVGFLCFDPKGRGKASAQRTAYEARLLQSHNEAQCLMTARLTVCPREFAIFAREANNCLWKRSSKFRRLRSGQGLWTKKEFPRQRNPALKGGLFLRRSVKSYPL